jgi:hypothetical protein
VSWSGLGRARLRRASRKCSVAPDYPCSKKLRLSKYSQTPRCPCIPGRRRPSVLDGPDHRGIRGKFSTRRFVPSFINFCTRTACTPHISSSAAASDSGGFVFFRARQIVLPSTSPDIERFPVRKTFGIRSSASSDCESEKHCKYAISSFNYLLLKQVMCHVTPGFPALQ